MGHKGPIYWPPRVPCSERGPVAVITGAPGQGRALQRASAYSGRSVQLAELHRTGTGPIDPFHVAEGPSACAQALRGQWVAWLDELGGPVLREELRTLDPGAVVIGSLGQGKSSERGDR